MSAAFEQGAAMTLGARGAEFQRIVANAEATDAAGKRRLGGKAVTLSGFKRDNPLRSLGDVNFWLDSADYGMVEIGHQFLLHNIADRIRVGL